MLINCPYAWIVFSLVCSFEGVKKKYCKDIHIQQKKKQSFDYYENMKIWAAKWKKLPKRRRKKNMAFVVLLSQQHTHTRFIDRWLLSALLIVYTQIFIYAQKVKQTKHPTHIFLDRRDIYCFFAFLLFFSSLLSFFFIFICKSKNNGRRKRKGKRMKRKEIPSHTVCMPLAKVWRQWRRKKT